jgi:hypothetical protein
MSAAESAARSTFGVHVERIHDHAIIGDGRSAALVPGLHPRMASEEQGPSVTRQLEPPGFLALNYGVRTPLTALAAHLVFGAILGAFYRVVGA